MNSRKLSLSEQLRNASANLSAVIGTEVRDLMLEAAAALAQQAQPPCGNSEPHAAHKTMVADTDGPLIASCDGVPVCEPGRRHSRPWCVTHDVPLTCDRMGQQAQPEQPNYERAREIARRYEMGVHGSIWFDPNEKAILAMAAALQAEGVPVVADTHGP